ncbi:MAG: sensor histidine kinase [Phormidium sp.]
MKESLKQFFRCLNSRLSHQIVGKIFISIVAIEVVILIPSYLRRQRELLRQLEATSETAIDTLVRVAEAGRTEKQELLDSLELFSQDSLIKGVSLYQIDGDGVGTFGEVPELTFEDISQITRGIQQRSWQGDRYDVTRVIQKMDVPYLLIVRHDSSSVQRELLQFTARIAGLVLLISIVVTGATFLIIQKQVITPLLQLRDDLTLAGDALSEGQSRPQFVSFHSLKADNHDELDETIISFSKMFNRVDSEIKRRQIAEIELTNKALKLERTLSDLKDAQMRLIQSEKMSSLGQLVAGIAHEINNPITFIQGNLMALKDYFKDVIEILDTYDHLENPQNPRIEELKDSLDFAYTLDDIPKSIQSTQVGATRIATIVESLRNFARLDESERKIVDSLEGLKNTLMLIESRLDAAKINLIQDYETLPKLDCYPGLLNQAFLAILNNAIDALEQHGECENSALDAPESGRKLTVTARYETAIAQIKIIIADNGPGMTPEVQRQIFDPFFTTKPVGQGTGLGLAIAYQIIVQDHHGDLRCESTPNQGTAFTISLPQQPNPKGRP